MLYWISLAILWVCIAINLWATVVNFKLRKKWEKLIGVWEERFNK